MARRSFLNDRKGKMFATKNRTADAIDERRRPVDGIGPVREHVGPAVGADHPVTFFEHGPLEKRVAIVASQELGRAGGFNHGGRDK